MSYNMFFNDRIPAVPVGTRRTSGSPEPFGELFFEQYQAAAVWGPEKNLLSVHGTDEQEVARIAGLLKDGTVQYGWTVTRTEQC